MTEIQSCLPAHAREHFLRVRNAKWEQARAIYNEKLRAIRQDAAIRNVLRSGHQELTEWHLSQDHVGEMARGYLSAAIETCTLYAIRLDERLCQCIKTSIKDFLIAQRKNALHNAAAGVPGAPKIPLSVRQQLSGDHNLPRLSEILIDLERARVSSANTPIQKESPMNQTFHVTGTNARVNIQSTDNSTNIVHEGTDFAEIRQVIEQGIADGIERTTLLANLKELEAATDRDSGSTKYQAFIASAANHMTLLGPYLPALGHWVHSLVAATS